MCSRKELEVKNKRKRVYIYGTGDIARKLVRRYRDSELEIVGILDRVRIYGYFEDIEIVEWWDIVDGDADAVIIAAPDNVCREIYMRILPYCMARNLIILDASGKSLKDFFGEKAFIDIKDEYVRTKAELLNRINYYDVISFDIFDTLLMRKVFEPLDVFSFVEDKISEDNPKYKCFRKYRRTAEISCVDGNIHEIYKNIIELMDLNEEESRFLLDKEIKSEKELLVVRKDVLDILNYALKIGKKVIAVSDMYLPLNIMTDILKEKGINGLDGVFISCDFRKSKNNGLFEKVRDRYDNRVLHIGDDYYADIMSPKRYDIDSIGVYKSSDLLRMKEKAKRIGYITNLGESIKLGEELSIFYNSPFEGL